MSDEEEDFHSAGEEFDSDEIDSTNPDTSDDLHSLEEDEEAVQSDARDQGNTEELNQAATPPRKSVRNNGQATAMEEANDAIAAMLQASSPEQTRAEAKACAAASVEASIAEARNDRRNSGSASAAASVETSSAEARNDRSNGGGFSSSSSSSSDGNDSNRKGRDDNPRVPLHSRRRASKHRTSAEGDRGGTVAANRVGSVLCRPSALRAGSARLVSIDVPKCVDLADHQGFRYTAYFTRATFDDGKEAAPVALRYNQVHDFYLLLVSLLEKYRESGSTEYSAFEVKLTRDFCFPHKSILNTFSGHTLERRRSGFSDFFSLLLNELHHRSPPASPPPDFLFSAPSSASLQHSSPHPPPQLKLQLPLRGVAQGTSVEEPLDGDSGNVEDGGTLWSHPILEAGLASLLGVPAAALIPN